MATHTDKNEYSDEDGTHVEETTTETTSKSTDSVPDGSGSNSGSEDTHDDAASGGDAG